MRKLSILLILVLSIQFSKICNAQTVENKIIQNNQFISSPQAKYGEIDYFFSNSTKLILINSKFILIYNKIIHNDSISFKIDEELELPEIQNIVQINKSTEYINIYKGDKTSENLYSFDALNFISKNSIYNFKLSIINNDIRIIECNDYYLGKRLSKLNTYSSNNKGNEKVEDLLQKRDVDWCTYLGGNGNDFLVSMDFDKDKNIIITGLTTSSNFPITPDAYQNAKYNGTDYVTLKVSPSGKLLWSTYFGGSSDEFCYCTKVDLNNNIWISGETRSSNIIATTDAYQKSMGGYADGILLSFTNAGQLNYFSYFGGSNYEAFNVIRFDKDNNLWLTGRSASDNFPLIKNTPWQIKTGTYALVFGKMNPLRNFEYLSFFGPQLSGSGDFLGEHLVCLSDGSVVICGFTNSSSLLQLNSRINTSYKGSFDLFLFRISSQANLIWSTYLGGSSSDRASNIAVDENDNTYLFVSTNSNNLPITTNAYQPVKNASNDFYLAKIDPSGVLLNSTYFGGNGNEYYDPFTTDRIAGGMNYNNGNLAIFGSTSSTDIPIIDCDLFPTSKSTRDDYFAIFDTNLQPSFSSFFGGSSDDYAESILLDGDAMYILGHTLSNNLPTTLGAIQEKYNSSYDGFLTKFTIKEVIPKNKIAGDTVLKLTTFACEGKELNLKPLTLHNLGNAPLDLYFTNSYFSAKTPGLKLVSPNTTRTLAPSDSIKINLAYLINSTSNMHITDTLYIPHDDLTATKKPWEIVIDIQLDSIKLVLSSNDLYFGIVPICKEKIDTLKIFNPSDCDITISTLPTIIGSNPENFEIVNIPNLPIIIKAGERVNIAIRFFLKNTSEGDKSAILKIIPDNKFVSISDVNLKGKIASQLVKITPNSINFADIAQSQTKDTTITIENQSPYEILVSSVIKNSADLTITPNNSIVKAYSLQNFKISWNTSSGNSLNDLLKFIISKECDDTLSLALSGKVIHGNIGYERKYDFNSLYSCKDSFDTVYIKNLFNKDITIYTLPTITGKDSSNFQLVNKPSLPISIKPGDSVGFIIRFFSQDELIGDKQAFLHISIDNGLVIIDDIELKGKIIPLRLSIIHNDIDFGTITNCLERIDSLIIKNLTDCDITMTKQPYIYDNNFDNFVILNNPNVPLTFKPGDSLTLKIKFHPTNSTGGFKFSKLAFTTTSNISYTEVANLHGIIEIQSLQIIPDKIDLGEISTPQIKDTTVIIRNNSKFDILVSTVLKNCKELIISPDMVFLKGNSDQIFNIRWDTKAKLDLYDNLRFVISKECPDTLGFNLSGTVSLGLLSYEKQMDFGDISSCDDFSDKIIIYSKGKNPIKIKDLKIIGHNSNAFKIQNQPYGEVTIAPNGKYECLITIINSMRVAGLNEGILQFTSIVDGVENIETINFSFKSVNKQITLNGLSSDSTINFGKVVLGRISKNKIMIRNTGTSDFTLDSVFFSINKHFSFPLNYLDKVIKPNDSLELPLYFSKIKMENGVIRDTLVIPLPCYILKIPTLAILEQPTISDTSKCQIIITAEPLETPKIAPNPANNEVNLFFNQNWNSEISLTITNQSGFLIDKFKLESFSKNQSFTIDTKNYESGIYFLIVSDEIGNVSFGKFSIIK